MSVPPDPPPFTQEEAEALGYAFTPDGEGVGWAHPETQDGHATGATPLFHALATIAEREEIGFAEGYGGDLPITDELILSVSGEDNTVF